MHRRRLTALFSSLVFVCGSATAGSIHWVSTARTTGTSVLTPDGNRVETSRSNYSNHDMLFRTKTTRDTVLPGATGAVSAGMYSAVDGGPGDSVVVSGLMSAGAWRAEPVTVWSAFPDAWSNLALTFESTTAVDFVLRYRQHAVGYPAVTAKISLGEFQDRATDDLTPPNVETIDQDWRVHFQVHDRHEQGGRTNVGGNLENALVARGRLDAGRFTFKQQLEVRERPGVDRPYGTSFFQLTLSPVNAAPLPDGPTPVPTPSALLAGSSLLGVMLIRRKRD
ncbi:MAG: hypothetical protein AAF328_03925 [Planctomycetota bacterium]